MKTTSTKKRSTKRAAKDGIVEPRKQIIKFVRPWLYPEQEEFLYNPARYSLVEAATKTGKTYGCIVWFIEQAATKGGRNKNFWWVAPNYSQAGIAYRRCLEYIPEQFRRKNDTHMTITLTNGAVMWFKSGEKPDTLYGEDVYAAVIDEATRMRGASWVAIRSTLTFTRGQVRIICNVKGKKNWAYKLARKAEAGAPNTYFARLTAYTAAKYGLYPIEEIEEARQTMVESAFNELYLCIATEDGANPFGHDHLDACGIDGLAKGPAICYGVDVARKQDWTVIVGLNKNLEVCEFHRFQQRPWPEIEDEIARVIRNRPTYFDSTGPGDSPLGHVQKKCAEVFGFVFSKRSKQDLMEHLASGIQRHIIKMPRILDEEDLKGEDDPRTLMKEMREFEYESTPTGIIYSAPEGLHDDCVCALALAYMCATRHNYHAVRPHTEPVYAPYAV